jgi:hypothetical protein
MSANKKAFLNETTTRLEWILMATQHSDLNFASTMAVIYATCAFLSKCRVVVIDARRLDTILSVS